MNIGGQLKTSPSFTQFNLYFWSLPSPQIYSESVQYYFAIFLTYAIRYKYSKTYYQNHTGEQMQIMQRYEFCNMPYKFCSKSGNRIFRKFLINVDEWRMSGNTGTNIFPKFPFLKNFRKIFILSHLPFQIHVWS